MGWNGGARYSTAGGAARGADCLGEDWHSKAGVARRALVRPGAERIGSSRQARRGAVCHCKERCRQARQARCSGAWPGGAVLGKAGGDRRGMAS